MSAKQPDFGDLDVSRETFERLEVYAALLRKWSPRINLVSRASLDDLWTRHIVDSLQIYDLAHHPVTHWVDIGSGAGFPGLVIAIAGASQGSPLSVTLVESDQRKAAFLRTVGRETGIKINVRVGRIEQVEPQHASIVSARALAPLKTLLEFADRHLDRDGVALFPKGARWREEVRAARESWSFDLETSRSKTEESSVILRIGGIARVGPQPA